MTENTDDKLLGNFRKLIDRCAGDSNFNPSNSRLNISSLEMQYATALTAVEDVDVKLAPNRVDINERKIAYEAVPKLFRRSRNYLRSTGASREFLEDAAGLLDKITGKRRTPVVRDNPTTPESEAVRTHSVAQLSYESILGNIRAYTELIRNETLYKPNEADLKTDHLDTVADDLEARNNAVSLTFVPVGQARNLRDRLLYNDPNCLVNTALAVKSYVSGLGTDSPLYRLIKGLKFRRQQK